MNCDFEEPEQKKIKQLIVKSNLDAGLKANHEDEWRALLNKTKDVPTYYMAHLVNYQSAVFKSSSKELINISLVLFNDKKVCGVWPLFLDLNNEEPIKSINDQFGGIVVPPLFVDELPKKSQRRIIKSCMQFLNNLVRLKEGSTWRTSEFSGRADISQWHQIALENDALLDRVNYELYVDLTLGMEKIRGFIRKSYKPLVSSGMKHWDVFVLDKYCEDTWTRFRELHKSVAGRVTRPIQSWQVQHDAIKSGDAFLVYVCAPTGEMVGGGLFDMSPNEGNYSVATYEKSLTDQPIGHLVQYKAIQTLIEKGRSRYFIGTRFYREDMPDVTGKQVDISNFKAGFATTILPRITLKLTPPKTH